MNPWKPESVEASEWSFHALRFAACVAAVAGWLLSGKPPGAAAPLSLAVAVVLDTAGHLAAGARPPAFLLTGAALAGLLALRQAGDAALEAALMAIVLGGARALPNAWAGPWSAAVSAAGMLEAVALTHEARTLVAVAAGFAAAAWFGRLHAVHVAERDAYRQAVAALEDAQARLAELAAKTRDLAAERERQNVLGAVHDTLGHALTANLLQVQVARQLIKTDPAAAEERLATVEASLRAALGQVRQALRRALHPERLPLASALQALTEDFAAAGGPKVTLSVHPDPVEASDVDPEVAEVLYRAVQEALTNAARHGAARHVRVRLAATPERLLLSVRDDGAGADRFVPGMGLGEMTARVQAVGGSIRFRTAPGAGFEVEIGVRRR